jgi:hypothetical protein
MQIEFVHSLNFWHLLLLLLSVLMLFWQFKKNSNWLNYVAIIIISLSIGILLLKPYSFTDASGKSLILIGTGIEDDLKDSLLKQSTYPVFTQFKGYHFRLERSDKRILLSEWPHQADTIFTFGYLPHIPISYNQLKVNSSAEQIAISVSEKIKLGDSVIVAIHNRSPAKIEVQTSFETEYMKTDSLAVDRELNYAFFPQTAGNYRTHIKLADSLSIYFNTLVDENKPLAVLLLADVPDNEWKFINAFFSEKGHAVYWRNRVSKDIYKKQLSNWPDSLSNRMDKELLNMLNLVVTDMAAWNRLSSKQRELLIEGNMNYRTSIIFRGNENGQLLENQSLPNIATNSVFETETGIFYTSFKNVNKWLSLNKLALVNKADWPGIGLLSIQNSYVWKLAGKNTKYNQFWQQLLDHVLMDSLNELIFKEPMAFVGVPFAISIWNKTNKRQIKLVSPTGDTLHLFTESKQNSLFKERNTVNITPDEIGWYKLFKGRKQIAVFYAHPRELVSKSVAHNIYAYKYQLMSDRLNNSTYQKKDKRYYTYWLVLLIVLCLTYLWAIDRLKG